MDNLILPDRILNKQVCTECLNYLSVGPVMVFCEEKVLCGRCSINEGPEWKASNQSLYNLVAEKLVFRCINYYEGCEELLNFNEAAAHEKNCKKDGLNCPFCAYKGNGCQLVHHFDKNHSDYVMSEDTFKIVLKENNSRHLIFVKNSNIFCLFFSVGDCSIEFFNLLISSTHLGLEQFKLRFFKLDTNIEFATLPIKITGKLENFPSNTLVQSYGSETTSIRLKNSFLLDVQPLLECFPSGWSLCKIKLIDNNSKMEEKILKLHYLEKMKNLPVGTLRRRRYKAVQKINENKFYANTLSRGECMVVEKGNKENLAAEPLKGEYKVVEKDIEESFDINCILNMSPSGLSHFVKTKLHPMQFCVCCKKYITTVVFFCPKYHMACSMCKTSKCGKCGTFCEWSIKPKLNVSLPCEWKGCKNCPNIFNYMVHKRDCKWRLYKCPDVDCGFESYLWEFKLGHWHMNTLLDCKVLKLPCENQGVFWQSKDYHEIFYVCIEYNFSHKRLSITISEVDVVMFASYNFYLKYDKNVPTKRICSMPGEKFEKNDVSGLEKLELSCYVR